MRRAMIAAALLAAANATDARGQQAPGPDHGGGGGGPRTLAAVRAEVKVDGKLDDAAWAAAPAAGGFVQRQPNTGAAATEATEARVAYGEDALYVAMRMHDSRADSIAAPLARRDAAGGYSDWAFVMLDSYGDRRTAFSFGVNPRGVKRDSYLFNDTQEDASWDAVWDVAVSVDSAGWTAEFRIPFSQLRFSPVRTAWGLNLQRHIARRDETVFWSPVAPDGGKLVSGFGTLAGLSGLRAPRRLEVKPYTVARVVRAPERAGDPFFRANDWFGSAGMDVKYGLTPELTLTATLNPDFGQVEADPSEVNLTAFESYLPERRPFFTEGVDVFNFNLGTVSPFGSDQLFYSRRIGRAPQRTAQGEFTDAPQSTNILGAAKLSGRTRGGWAVGVLNATTAEERARVASQGRDSVITVEPLANYSVARAVRRFGGGRSALGTVFTSTLRDAQPGSGVDFLHSSAFVGGADARHRFGGGNHELRTWVLGSHVRGGTTALIRTQRSSARYFQRPDRADCSLCPELDSSRTSLSGAAANFELARIGGGNWRWSLKGTARSPGFESNDLGFQQVADVAAVMGGVRYVQPRSGRLLRQWSLAADAGSSWTFGGERTLDSRMLTGTFQLHNLWSGSASLIQLAPSLSPSELRGGPALLIPERRLGFVNLASDPRRRVRLGMGASVQSEDGAPGTSWNVSPSLTIRPSGRSEVMLQPVYARNFLGWQYLGRQGSGAGMRYMGAEMDMTTAMLVTRLSYTFTPTLSLQFYAQPFVSAARFSDFRRVADARASSPESRFAAVPDAELKPDFNQKEFRSNSVLRWEYKPGSTLFVVWSQGRQQVLADGSFDASRDMARLMGFDDEHPARATNVLLLRLNFWLGR